MTVMYRLGLLRA